MSVRMLCVAQLGAARRVDSLSETVHMRKVGSPPRVTLSHQPSDHTPMVPRARSAVSHVNGRR